MAGGAAAPTTKRRVRGRATALFLLGSFAAVARAEDPLINVYMRGSADRVSVPQEAPSEPPSQNYH